jgi:hypothetical protein
MSRIPVHTVILLVLWGLASQTSATESLFEMQESARSEIYHRCLTLKAEGSTTVLDLKGEGVINRLWFTFIPGGREENDRLGRALVVNIFWEGCDKPAVSAPLADLFCQPIQLQAIDNHFFTSSNRLCVFNSLIPMPFRRTARIALVNRSQREMLFWYSVDVEWRKLKSNALYFHAYWHCRDVGQEDEIVVLPEVAGSGRYLGTHWALRQKKVSNSWDWYKRPVRIHLDEADTTNGRMIKVGTLDDFVRSGWWSNERPREPYALPFTGRPLVHTDTEGNLRVVFYRYRVRDPLWFHNCTPLPFVFAEMQPFSFCT